MITLLDFLDKYLGKSKGYPTDKNYKGECLSVCKLYIKEVFGLEYPPASGCNGARCYYSKFPSPLDTVFKKVKNTLTLIPKEGWIVIWKAWANNSFGHIAIVAKGSTKTVLMNYAQNWSSKIFQLEKNNYNNVEGYLVPIKESAIIEDMTKEEERILKVVKENKLTEGNVRALAGWIKDGTMEAKDKQIQTLNAKVLSLDSTSSNLLIRIEALEGKIKANNDLVSLWQRKILSANKQVEKLSKQYDDMWIEKNKFKNYYEKALDKSADKLSAIELLRLLIKKLFKK